MSDKQERMSDLDFGRYESPSANSLTLKESRSAYWAVVAECRRAREVEEELEAILHDANSVPLSEVASEMAALRENVDGTAALLVEAEKERDEALARLEIAKGIAGDLGHDTGSDCDRSFCGCGLEILRSALREPTKTEGT